MLDARGIAEPYSSLTILRAFLDVPGSMFGKTRRIEADNGKWIGFLSDSPTRLRRISRLRAAAIEAELCRSQAIPGLHSAERT
jgi:hypothetical protein